jgi:hypothetical protein
MVPAQMTEPAKPPQLLLTLTSPGGPAHTGSVQVQRRSDSRVATPRPAVPRPRLSVSPLPRYHGRGKRAAGAAGGAAR